MFVTSRIIEEFLQPWRFGRFGRLLARLWKANDRQGVPAFGVLDFFDRDAASPLQTGESSIDSLGRHVASEEIADRRTRHGSLLLQGCENSIAYEVPGAASEDIPRGRLAVTPHG